MVGDQRVEDRRVGTLGGLVSEKRGPGVEDHARRPEPVLELDTISDTSRSVSEQG